MQGAGARAWGAEAVSSFKIGAGRPNTPARGLRPLDPPSQPTNIRANVPTAKQGGGVKQDARVDEVPCPSPQDVCVCVCVCLFSLFALPPPPLSISLSLLPVITDPCWRTLLWV